MMIRHYINPNTRHQQYRYNDFVPVYQSANMHCMHCVYIVFSILYNVYNENSESITCNYVYVSLRVCVLMMAKINE